MKKKLLIGAFLMGSMITASAQTTVWSEDFNDGNADGWSLVDVDGDSQNWSVVQFQDAGGNPTGTPLLRSFSWLSTPPPTGTPLNPNNWAVSPAINLSNASGTITLRWEAQAVDADYDAENYTVYVATNNTEAAFLAYPTPFNEALTGVNTLTARTLDISNFAGQTIFVAFRHHDVSDQFSMELDNISVTAATLGVDSNLASQFSVFPNPASNTVNVTTADNVLVNAVSIVDINGRTVKSAKFDGVSNAQINISDLATGMYMMNIASDKGTTTKKIVKN